MTSLSRNNLIGAVLANVINISSIMVFVFRLLEEPDISHWTGLILELCIFPLVYLIYTARRFNRPKIYYIWVGLMIAFIIVEFFLDWYPGIDFRDNLSIVIPYVMLFFGSTGGMIGVARLAGRKWAVLTIITCLIMFVLAFVQRQVTGM